MNKITSGSFDMRAELKFQKQKKPASDGPEGKDLKERFLQLISLPDQTNNKH